MPDDCCTVSMLYRELLVAKHLLCPVIHAIRYIHYLCFAMTADFDSNRLEPDYPEDFLLVVVLTI